MRKGIGTYSPKPTQRNTDASARLTAAMEGVTPACSGDDRFIQDWITKSLASELEEVCLECPLYLACLEFAKETKPPAGFWAGQHWKGRR